MAKNKLILLLPILILAFPACIRQKIKTDKTFKKLNHINKYEADFSEQKKDVLLNIKKFTSKDCAIFGVNTIQCGYQPLQITITNFTDDTIHLGPTNIGLSLVSPKKVAKACHWKTAEITTGAGVISCIFYWPALIYTAYSGYQMKKANEEITKKIVEQDLIQCWDSITVLPFETISRIFFVSNENFKNSFPISVFSRTSKNIEFYVNFGSE